MYKVTVNSAGHRQWPENWTWAARNNRRFPDWDLWTVIKGTGSLETPFGNWNVQRGSCFILPGGYDYIGRSGKHDPAFLTYIHFNFLDDDNKIIPVKKHPNPPDLFRKIQDMNFFSTLLDRVVRDFRQNKEATVWLQAALQEATRDDHLEVDAGQSDTYAKLRAICSEVWNDPAAPYTLEDGAASLNCTTRNFSRIFKKYYHETFMDFVIKVRVTCARQELLNSSDSITQIATNLGYQDIAYFSRQFKKTTGFSPREFRKIKVGK